MGHVDGRAWHENLQLPDEEVTLPAVACWTGRPDPFAPVHFTTTPGLQFLRSRLPALNVLENPSAPELIQAIHGGHRALAAIFDWSASRHAAEMVRSAHLQDATIALSGNLVALNDLDAFARLCIRQSEADALTSPFDTDVRESPHPFVRCTIGQVGHSSTAGCLFEALPDITATSVGDVMRTAPAARLDDHSMQVAIEGYCSSDLPRLLFVAASDPRNQTVDCLLNCGLNLQWAATADHLPVPDVQQRCERLHVWLEAPDAAVLESIVQPQRSTLYLPVGTPSTTPSSILDLIAWLGGQGVTVVPRWYAPLPNTREWSQLVTRYGVRSGVPIGDPRYPVFDIPGWEDVDGPTFLRRCALAGSSRSTTEQVTFADVVAVSSRYLRNIDLSSKQLQLQAVTQVSELASGGIRETTEYPFFTIGDQNPIALCNVAINAAFSAFDTGPLRDSLRYLEASAGKRLRGVFTLALADSSGVPPDVALRVAAAVEIIHAASLIQDDLPCMDDDGFRRGTRALHRVFGEATALLTSDALLVIAIRELLRLETVIGSSKTVRIIDCVLQALGPHGLIAGQMFDLQARQSHTETTVADLLRTYRHKTAPLFELIGRSMGVLSDQPRERAEQLAQAMSDIGVAFQIVDDALDAHLGKLRLHESDSKNGSVTLARKLGPEPASQYAKNLINDAAFRLDGHGTVLRNLAEFVLRRDF